jgi:hypothetical protein
MDGTIVDTYNTWKGKLEEFTEAGFFRNLPAKEDDVVLEMLNIVNSFEMAFNQNVEIHILSACPCEVAKIDKAMWIQEHLGDVVKTENIHFMMVGENKAKSVIGLNKYDFLIDDYGKNLKEWHEAGGTSIKVYPTTGKERVGYTADTLFHIHELVEEIQEEMEANI